MKIKFSRQQGTQDISCYTPSAEKKGKGRWISRIKTLKEEELKLGDQFASEMTSAERYGIKCLLLAIRLAEAAENIYLGPTLSK